MHITREHLAALLFPGDQGNKTLPFPFGPVLVWGSCLLPGRGQTEELPQMDTAHGTRQWFLRMALRVLINKVEEWRFLFLSGRP